MTSDELEALVKRTLGRPTTDDPLAEIVEVQRELIAILRRTLDAMARTLASR